MALTFSIVIPVFNAAAYVEDCLKSVSNQSFADFECICVDDGSTDGSWDVLSAHACADSRFRPIRQANAGRGGARNAGLAAAKGDWICFLDADDVLNRRTLETYAEGIARNPNVDVVSLDALEFEDDAEPAWGSDAKSDWRIVDTASRVPVEACCRPLWACAYRNALAKDVRFGRLPFGEDRVYYIQVLDRVRCMALNDFRGYAYRQHAESAVHAPLTAETFISDVRHAIAVMEIKAASKKAYADEVWRKHGLWFVERFVFAFFRLPEADRTRIWPEYLSSMRRACAFRQTPATVRCLLRLVLSVRSQRVMRVLCSTVYWMKRHGVNRHLAVHVK